MKSFLLYIFGILLIIVLSSCVLDTLYTAAFTSGFSRNKTQYAVQLQNTHVDYIFLGSSRVENNVDCEIITKITGKSCVNLGLQGSKTNDSAALLQILKDNNVTYDKVLFQLDYAVNFDSYAPAFLASIAPFENSNLLSDTLKNRLNTPSKNMMPFVRYASNDKLAGLREVVLQTVQKPANIDFTNGFLGIDRVGRKMNGTLPKNIVELNKGVEWMRENEPNHLILFTAPYCKKASNRDVFVKQLQDFYPEVISFIDVFDNTEENYADCGHLNIIGASHFSEILAKELLLNQIGS